MSDDFGTQPFVPCQTLYSTQVMQKNFTLLLLCLIGLTASVSKDIASKALFVTPQEGWRLNSSGGIEQTTDAGKSWQISYSSENQVINDIHFLSTTDGWAVGKDALVLRWDGEKWTEVFVFATGALHDVHLSSPEYGWAVGDRGTILHWDGTAWTAFPCPLDEALVKIEHNETGAMRIRSQKGTLIWRERGEWQITPPASE